MNGGGMYEGKNRLYEILGVWKKRISHKRKIEADILIAHSLGCNWALRAWEKNKHLTLILINPLLPKRKIFTWFLRWKKFQREEVRPKTKEVIGGFRNKLFGFKTCWDLLRYDFDKIISQIPREKLTIIHGEKDIFYCDEIFKKYIREKNIISKEIKNAWHDWRKEFDQAIEEIISE